ncbi:unnamed protein product, partial [Iphiclides podalirius]
MPAPNAGLRLANVSSARDANIVPSLPNVAVITDLYTFVNSTCDPLWALRKTVHGPVMAGRGIYLSAVLAADNVKWWPIAGDAQVRGGVCALLPPHLHTHN